jgi:hypothetical protein
MDRAVDYIKPRSIAVSPDSQYLACLVPCQSGQRNDNWCAIKLWDLASGKEKAMLEEKTHGYHTPLVFSQDSRYLAAGINRLSE